MCAWVLVLTRIWSFDRKMITQKMTKVKTKKYRVKSIGSLQKFMLDFYCFSILKSGQSKLHYIPFCFFFFFFLFQDGRTSLALASVSSKDDIVKLLISKKANILIRDNVRLFDLQRFLSWTAVLFCCCCFYTENESFQLSTSTF